MADEDTSSPETRKTVSFTHKQLGWSGGVIASLALVTQLKGSFITREEGVAQSKEIKELLVSQDRQFLEVKQLISSAQEELTRKIERSSDKLVERIKEEEARTVHTLDGQGRRIDSLEQVVLMSKSKSKITN